MAPHPTISRRYYNCDPGYNWYTCNIDGQSYYGCCSVDPCGSASFCPAGRQDLSSVGAGLATVATTSTSTSIIFQPLSTYPTLNDNVPPNVGGPPPPDGDYGSATTISSTYTESPSQAGVAIAATVGTLVFVGLIVICLWVYRLLLRRARAAKEEEERRIKKERRRKVYPRPPSPSNSGSSSDRVGTSHGRTRLRGQPSSPVINPSSYPDAYSPPYSTELDYRYETRYGVHYSTQLPTPLPTVTRPARSTPRNLGSGSEDLRFEDRLPVVSPVSPYTGVPPFDETNPHDYRRHSADSVSPKPATTMPSEGYFVEIPERVVPDGSGCPKTYATTSNNPFQTLHRPVGYQGGAVRPVWDSNGVLQEVYVEDWTGIKQ